MKREKRWKLLRRRLGTWIEYVLALPRVWSPPKTFVVILCSMRSGSTLLNALLAEAPDVSQLPETRWDHYLKRRNRWDRRAENLSRRRIVIFKSPPWLTSTARDTRIRSLPVGDHLKIILLARDAYPVVKSLEKILGDRHGNTERLIRYWCEAYESAAVALSLDSRYVRLVRYEDLTADPTAVTGDLFRFIGSQQQEGVDRYSPPEKFEWRWGQSDASEKIKSLRVQAETESTKAHAELTARLARDERVANLRRVLGYGDRDQ